MATRSVTQFYDNALRPSGLRSTQFNILSVIAAAGPATVTQLTKLLAMDQTTVTRSLALLNTKWAAETGSQRRQACEVSRTHEKRPSRSAEGGTALGGSARTNVERDRPISLGRAERGTSETSGGRLGLS